VWRILAWGIAVVFGFLVNALAPLHAQAQQAPEEHRSPAQVDPGRLGAKLRELVPESVKALGLIQEHAVLVLFSFPGGPAARAGLQPGDVILNLQGVPVSHLQGFISALQSLGVGQVATLDILRGHRHLTARAMLAREIGQPADEAESTIEASEAILGIFNREVFPQDWATTQHDLGDAYADRIGGDHDDNLEKAIAAYEAALTVRTREDLPIGWADTQNNLGVAFANRNRGKRADNLEKAIAAYEAALTVRTREDLPLGWADTQNNLGVAFANRNRGKRADNLEKAIAAYEAALTVRTREAFPQEWALTQYNLGVTYNDRIGGDHDDNLEKAIAAFEAALTVLTRDAVPWEWAQAQQDLGSAYLDRVSGDRADNLEKAIAAFSAALTVRTREAAPKDWAQIQNSLGIAYRARIRGDHLENVEAAIAAYEAALTVRTREAMPSGWAVTQNNLGGAYLYRVRGDRADNVEKSIAAYEAALTIRTRETRPNQWGMTQSNLGGAYWARVRGDRADNLEKALAALEAALAVRTRESAPKDWAETQNNLGNVYLARIRGDRADNQEKAIAAYEQALTIRTLEGARWDWATTQHNLGSAYSERIRGNRADNLEQAIAAFEAALTVSTREALPRDWADTQSTLGIVYQNRIRGDRSDNLDRARAAFEAALTVRTREADPLRWAKALTGIALIHIAYADMGRDRTENIKGAIAAFEAVLSVETLEALPRDHMISAELLGEVLLAAGDWRMADRVLAGSRDAFLLLFGQGLNDAETRQLTESAGRLLTFGAYAAAQLGDSERALTLAVEGRARLMAVALKLQMLDLPAEKRKRLDTLRAQAREADRAVEATQGTERAAAVERLIGVRQKLLELVKDAAASDETKRGSPLAQARVLTRSGDVIVIPILTGVGGKLLVVTNGEGPSASTAKARKTGAGADVAVEGTTPSIDVLDVPDLTRGKLDQLIHGHGSGGGWVDAYKVNYLTGEELNRRWPEWLSALGNIGPELWDLVGARLDAALKQAGVRPGARIIWMPSGALGILPLGLAQDPATKGRLADDYEIVYAPSLEALTEARNRIDKTAPTLAAVVNPLGDLPGTEKEAALVASYFPSKARMVRDHKAATPEAVLAALKGRSYWHFATHGTFSWDDARQSGLYMSGPALLTVGKLLETDGLGRPRLVVLSACETGLYDINRNPNEFIGLPGTFTALGAAGVLGTLWPVSDTASALLVAKFYELHLGNGLAPPTALRRAQLWLRQATSANLSAYAAGAVRQGRLDRRHLSEIEADLSEEGLKRSRNAAVIQWLSPSEGEPERGTPGKRAPVTAKHQALPYAHPYYWAGFIYTGL